MKIFPRRKNPTHKKLFSHTPASHKGPQLTIQNVTKLCTLHIQPVERMRGGVSWINIANYFIKRVHYNEIFVTNLNFALWLNSWRKVSWMNDNKKLTINQVEYHRRRKTGIFTFLHQAGENFFGLGWHGVRYDPLAAIAWCQDGARHSRSSPAGCSCIQLLK